MNQRTTISAQNLSIGYSKSRRKEAIHLYENLSFSSLEGELVCLIGSNGSGKSTLLRTISKMQPALNGTINIFGKDIAEYTGKQLSQTMGLVLTDKTASGGFTVREVVELGRYPYTGFFGILNDEDNAIVNQALSDVGIEHKADSYIADLSDGERQKAMIAKALSQQCPIIILDEPTAFLDVESRIEIMNLLHKLAHQNKKTILLSTHDIDLAFLLSDKLWLLSKDAKFTAGVTEDIILSGQIDRFFSNENIAFNKFSGTFYPIRHAEEKIYVKAEDEFLFWSINLLLRLGLDYTTEKGNSIYTLEVKNADSIVLSNSQESLQFAKFEELANYLRNIEK